MLLRLLFTLVVKKSLTDIILVDGFPAPMKMTPFNNMSLRKLMLVNNSPFTCGLVFTCGLLLFT